MFEFLKNLISRAVPIEITNFHEPVVTFTATNPLKLGALDVIATVKEETIRLRVHVDEKKEAYYLGRVLEPVAAVPFLAEQFPDEPRRAKRYLKNMRVLSKELSGFKASSRDISETGIRIEAEAPLPLGSYVSLQIDLDDNRGSTVTLTGEVKWCAPKTDMPSALLGIEFHELDRNTHWILTSFLRTLKEDFTI